MRAPKRRPILILLASLGVLALLVLVQRRPEERAPTVVAPLVRTVVAEPSRERLTVSAHGEVSPRTESDLIPQVSGEIVHVSPSLVTGGFFEKGDVLARIEPADYRVEHEAANAAVARAESGFDRAKKELERQRQLERSAVTSEARIDDAENAFKTAEASLAESRAKQERAERDLARTTIRAPYRGRVRSESVDVGQFVNRGAPIARIYAIEWAEVRLPLPDRELAYLDVPLSPKAAAADTASGGARVRLSADFAGERHVFEGRLVRTEGELDPKSRMIHVVARVEDPYGLETKRSTPLAVGLFVDAEIEGIELDGVIALPREALRDVDQVFLVDADNRLRIRTIELVRAERDRILVRKGLAQGDRVCISPLQAAIDGMAVRVAEAEAAP